MNNEFEHVSPSWYTQFTLPVDTLDVHFVVFVQYIFVLYIFLVAPPKQKANFYSKNHHFQLISYDVKKNRHFATLIGIGVPRAH